MSHRGTGPGEADGQGRVTGVSLVVPVRDESKTIAALLSSIKAQTRRPEEVVIVDGGSSDGTPDLVRHLMGDDPTVQIVEVGAATPGRGRNAGRAVARKPWIAFTDAGIELHPRWLERLVDAAERDPTAEAVYGTYDPMMGSFFASCAVAAYVPARHATPVGELRGPSVASMMIRGDVFDRVEGFPDLRAAEDLIFFDRLEQHHVSATWAPDAVAYWQVAPSVSATFRRFRLYSRQNVLIGRQRQWHYGVARIYAVGAVVMAIGLTRDRRILLALPLGALTRASHNLWKHKNQYGLGFVLNPGRVAGVTALTLVIDAATFAGWASAAVRRPRRCSRAWDRPLGIRPLEWTASRFLIAPLVVRRSAAKSRSMDHHSELARSRRTASSLVGRELQESSGEDRVGVGEQDPLAVAPLPSLRVQLHPRSARGDRPVFGCRPGG